jgi:sulfite exporter TauE/SafE
MFVLGLVTSLHCVSMCGPMVVTYAVKGDDSGPWHSKLIPSFAYQGAKISSYVVVGLVLGAVGSAFNVDAFRPYVMLAAGIFMIVMGLGMTGKAPWAARLVPRAPKFLTAALSKARHKATADAQTGESSLATPVTFGLLTGLMPCAPLIAAELAAAATGSVLGGGIAMLAFGLGTAPLMLVFGTASSLLTRTLRERVMALLAIVVILFGVVYIDRAAMRLGSPVTFASGWQALAGTPKSGAQSAPYTTGADGVAEVPLTIRNTQYVPQTVQIPADRPVRLIVDRQEDVACSAQLAIPQLGVLADLKPNGVTKVDVPAAKAGKYTLTCGMGMMSGTLVVGSEAASSTDSRWRWALVALFAAGGVLWLSSGARRSTRELTQDVAHNRNTRTEKGVRR